MNIRRNCMKYSMHIMSTTSQNVSKYVVWSFSLRNYRLYKIMHVFVYIHIDDVNVELQVYRYTSPLAFSNVRQKHPRIILPNYSHARRELQISN